MGIPVIIDTDPGHDDAFAIMMALASDRIEVKGICSVAGNSVIENTTRNVLRILERVKRTGVPVARGIGKPMCGPLRYEAAKKYHGESGLDGVDFPEVATPLSPLHAVDFMADIVQKSAEKVTLVPVGPLTNVGAFILCYPELLPKIERICLMGGLTYPDPNSAAAVSEYNVYQDPEAAHIVFSSGIPVVMHSINSTGLGKVTDREIDHMATLGSAGAFAAELMNFYRRNFRSLNLSYYNICDSHAVAYLIDPSIYEGKPAFVELDLRGKYTRGMTVCDLRENAENPPNCFVVLDCHTEAYFELLFQCLKNLG
jgi:inosine-uridine nucleoside N-ribohydrolase